jgi:hypothetical protein
VTGQPILTDEGNDKYALRGSAERSIPSFGIVYGYATGLGKTFVLAVTTPVNEIPRSQFEEEQVCVRDVAYEKVLVEVPSSIQDGVIPGILGLSQ